MRVFSPPLVSPFDVDEGSPFRAEFKGYFSK